MYICPYLVGILFAHDSFNKPIEPTGDSGFRGGGTRKGEKRLAVGLKVCLRVKQEVNYPAIGFSIVASNLICDSRPKRIDCEIVDVPLPCLCHRIVFDCG